MDSDSQVYDRFDGEEYMNPNQLKFFQNRLLTWRRELLQATMDTDSEMQENDYRKADPVDMGSMYAESERLLLARNRRGNLLKSIEHALSRIEDGTYGYCEMTGDEIGLKRLAVMPLATLTIEAQQRLERMPALSLG